MNRLGFFIYLIIVFISFSCQSDNTDQKEVQTPEQLAEELEVIEVEVAKAEKKTIHYFVKCYGKIEPVKDAELQFRSNGILQAVLVRNGQKVKKGELIARLDPTDEMLKLERAVNEMKLADQKYKELQAAYDLHDKDEALQRSIREGLRLKSGVHSAEIQLKEAKINMQKTQLTAPFDGVVSGLVTKVGNEVTSSERFCRIYSDNQLLLKADMLETEVKNVKTGLEAEVNVIGALEQKVYASVSEIDPQVDENGMVTIWLSLHQSNGFIPGMNAKAAIQVPKPAQIVVPVEAVVSRSDREVVYTVQEGIAKWNYVKTGFKNNAELQILEGLKAGSSVIVSNNLQLAHDTPVRITQ